MGLKGGAEITRPDNAVPYRKGGHRETCFSVRVDAQYKFMFDEGILYELLIGFMFVTSPIFQKIALQSANEIRFLCKVNV